MKWVGYDFGRDGVEWSGWGKEEQSISFLKSNAVPQRTTLCLASVLGGFTACGMFPIK